jgi:hypothetical protein
VVQQPSQFRLNLPPEVQAELMRELEEGKKKPGGRNQRERAAQRIAAAFLAISLRSLADNFFARALPPLRPPARASSETLSRAGVSSISPVAIRIT